MDRDYVLKENVVDRYVRDQLSEEEMDAFEIYMLDNPSVATEVDLASNLHRSMKSNAASILGQQEASNDESFWTPAIGKVASVLAVVGLATSVGFSLQTAQLGAQIAATKIPRGIASQIWLQQSRGLPKFTAVLPEVGGVMLQVDVGPELYATYGAVISSQSDSSEWTLTGLKADENNLVPILLPTVPPGEYIISVAPDDRQSAVVEYTVEFSPSQD